jgi:hypothetical protein
MVEGELRSTKIKREKRWRKKARERRSIGEKEH